MVAAEVELNLLCLTMVVLEAVLLGLLCTIPQEQQHRAIQVVELVTATLAVLIQSVRVQVIILQAVAVALAQLVAQVAEQPRAAMVVMVGIIQLQELALIMLVVVVVRRGLLRPLNQAAV